MNKRLEILKKILLKQHLDAILISSVPTIIYFTGYSGFSKEEREAFLFVTKNNQYVITDGRYSEAIITRIPHFELVELNSTTSLSQILRMLVQKNSAISVGFEHNNLTLDEYQKIKDCFKKPIPFSLHEIRILKEPLEIQAIQKACKFGDNAFEYILGEIKQGITEKELAFLLEMFVKKQGADLSFPTIVAFGKNAAIPHHQTSDQRLASNGQFVLLDFGVKIDNYCSDMTRTVFFGKASKEQKHMYQTVSAAQQAAISYIATALKQQLPFKAAAIDKIARDYIISQGYPTIPHSLGHGIGIEVHESPRLSPKSQDILRPGMVFSVEPGIYLPKTGGVRIEDLIALTKKGPELLTTAKRSLIEM